MKQAEKLRRVRKALDAYDRTGARDLPSVKKSVPRAFLSAVDTLVEEIDAALEGRPS